MGVLVYNLYSNHVLRLQTHSSHCKTLEEIHFRCINYKHKHVGVGGWWVACGDEGVGV